MGSHQPIRKTVTPEIPDKLYFRIGDVATLCDLPAYVLRFWETEFPQLKPNKGGTGQRLYRKRDVELVLRIKSLLYDQGYTIPGARQILKSGNAESALVVEAIAEVPAPVDSHAKQHRDAQLQSLRTEMTALLSMLSRPVSTAAAPVPTAKLKAMRPRLVLEPKLHLAQPGLFGDDPAEPAE